MLIPALPRHLYPLNVGGNPSFTPLPVGDNLPYLQLSSWIISCISHLAAKSYCRYKRPRLSVTVQLLLWSQSRSNPLRQPGNLDPLCTFGQIYFAIRKNTLCNLNKYIFIWSQSGSALRQRYEDLWQPWPIVRICEWVPKKALETNLNLVEHSGSRDAVRDTFPDGSLSCHVWQLS